jgi:hypothetical protein
MGKKNIFFLLIKTFFLSFCFLGICEKPSPIQEHSIPISPTNRDVFARAKKWYKQNWCLYDSWHRMY